ncbi:MAG: amino acid adenylation domain-containing protein [candidate division KSB1 bacterium]|nr:amino acid adenylation domain-containing protein [candidate division KSB1 bacterium]MDZ7273650.1 amino acid adenylation domain-containing protein [candidate division KSB1 bacterium]MDZ7286759.1 amino acid adenylation domain-containing protein [candidate division KSB1 bacterium]MDZ7299884.1 amino acid adenylation domain-containing protein [candidate division KSB1 bacterium]MDZ7305821.1 amino acid adenylation domain-containing protein [candidate division KSB1 bacterium]
MNTHTRSDLAALAAQIAGLPPEKRQLLEKLFAQQGVNFSALAPIPRRHKTDVLPLSFSQQRLWFLDQLNPGSAFYNIAYAIHLQGGLDTAALSASLNEIIRRHEILRTTFDRRNGQPVQIIADTRSLELPVIDLQQLDANSRRAEAERLAAAEAGQPYDLARGPLLRATLLRLQPAEHLLLLGMHHIIADGWSMAVLIREMSALYTAFRSGRPSPLPPLRIQYADFALWQRDRLQGTTLENLLAYWKQRLGPTPPVLELPTDRPRPAVQSFNGATLRFELPQLLHEQLKDLCQQQGVTLFMCLLAAFKVLLCRYSGQQDICVGTPVANRNRAETEELIGFFVNTLALRSDLSGDPTFSEVLQRVRETALGAFEHQDLPFERLVEELQPERDMSRSPLFQVMFTFQNAAFPDLQLPGLRINVQEVDSHTVKFDLLLSMEENNGLRGKLEYATDLFDAATMQRLLGHFRTLLEGIVANPGARLSQLPLLTADERRQLLVEWQPDQPVAESMPPIHHRIAEQAARTPDAIAVVCGERQLSYAELNRRANQLAHLLRKSGVGPEVIVGLYLERSPEAVIGLLGILKAGGVYLPLDPAYPRDRLTFMLKDARAAVVLTQPDLVATLPPLENATVLPLDAAWQALSRERDDTPPTAVHDGQAAYVIYTSGSTGRPKGVLVSHGTLAKHCLCMREYYELTPADRVLQFAALNFDASLEQMLPALLAGAQLVLRDATLWTPAEFHQKVAAHGLTVINLPTAYWQELAQHWSEAPGKVSATNLRLVIIGGDEMPAATLRLWQRTPLKHVRLLNAYGPTETTITATAFEVPPEFAGGSGGRRVPIGRLLSGRRAYILDRTGGLVPVGIPGELHLGGAGVARGYLRRPDLTAERFVPDPFATHAGARLYKTGDLARWRPDGTIEFLGRRDHQVKIRGFRIELGEIEAVLRRHPAVRQAVVLAREDRPGDKRLVAYFVAASQDRPTVSELRHYLKSRLPEYMIPAAFVALDEFPQTPGGKVDLRSLPAPDESRPELESAYVAPRTPTESVLAALVAEVLHLERVGIHDNFFELGGHSLLATQVMSQVREIFQVEVPLRRIFETPTVEGLALALAEAQAGQEDRDKLEKMLADLDQLSDEEVQKLLQEEESSLV